MKAVILREPRVMEVADVPKPKMTSEHHVIIRVEACGICGSDLRYWNGENPWALHTLGRHVPNPPNIILGHEFAGTVVEVNSSAWEPLLGKRVGAQAFRVCGQCAFCRSGRENLCRETIHIGHAQGWGKMDLYPGAYAEYCLGWGDLVFPIPDEVPLEHAALADILCVAVHAVGRSGRAGGNVLCIGGGPVGLSISQVARTNGAGTVFVSELSPVAHKVLDRFDNLVIIDPRRQHFDSVLGTKNGSGRLAAIYDSIGGAETMSEVLPFLEESGTYVNLAVHDTPLHLNAAMLGSEKTITSSSNAFYRDVARAYELICTRQIDLTPMITHRFSLDRCMEAFDLLLRSPKEAYKVILNPC